MIQCQNCDLISLDYLMNILHINIFNMYFLEYVIFLQMQMIKSHDFAFSDKKLKSNGKILHTSFKECAVTKWVTLFGMIYSAYPLSLNIYTSFD